MKLIKTKINGPLLIKSNIFKDKRGYLRETFRNSFFKKEIFPFEIMSFSKKNVLRGLHIQTKKSQSKILSVLHGEILDVVVDLRKNSKTFGKHFMIKIKSSSDFSFYIPAGFAHGFICLTKNCIVNYKCSNYRDKASEKTLSWNDKELNIQWPCKNPILSRKDSSGLSLNFFK